VLLASIAFGDALFQALVAIVHLRLTRTPAPRGVLRAPVVAGLTFLLLSLAMALGSLSAKPGPSTVGVGALALGLGVWLWWRRT